MHIISELYITFQTETDGFVADNIYKAIERKFMAGTSY
jgi:hypothetical protein